MELIRKELRKTSAGASAYSSAKRGMNGIFRVLAQEAAPYNITVNEVAPGWTISDASREEKMKTMHAISKMIPMGVEVLIRKLQMQLLFSPQISQVILRAFIFRFAVGP